MANEFNDFAKIADKIEPACKKIVRKTMRTVRDSARNLAPKDTGLLKRSVYYTGGGGSSTYGQIVQQAGSLSRKGFISRRRLASHFKRVERQRKQEALIFPEMPPPPSATEGYVAVAATYGVYVELGTRKMPARPFFYPALNDGQQVLEEELSKFEDSIKV